MGNAPQEQQPMTLPTPDQLAAQAVDALVTLGMDRQYAAATVLQVAVTVRMRLWPGGADGGAWLTEVINAADLLLRVPAPSVTDQSGDEHGDGPGCRTGSATQDRGE